MDTVDNPSKHAAGLSAVWQNRISLISGSDYRMLTPKEHGQLKRLKDSLGVERSTQMIQYAIQNWETFARRVTQNVGIEVFPTRPHVGFLLKYHATALILMLERMQSLAKEKAFEAQVASTKAQWQETGKAEKSPKVRQVPKQQPATIEEIETIMAELGFGMGATGKTTKGF
jgi:phosphate starvation-inducible protein PhoH